MKTIYVKDILKQPMRRVVEQTAKYDKSAQGVQWKKTGLALALLAAVLLGMNALGEKGEATSTDGSLGVSGSQMVSETLENELQGGVLLASENWGLGFGKEGERPTGNASPAELAEYNAYFCADSEEKVLYLTFDCGFENGNTEAILDALKKHNVKATFFVVGHYLESAPELVKRMVEEGHTVGNHTYHHPDMSQISDAAAFQKEMDDVAVLFKEITGQEMEMYYRPPQGKYSTQNLQMAKDLGYSTFFWSLAYVDWYQDKQPTHAEAFDKLTKRVHPGAIVLLHNTSKTNGEIMDEILTKWEEMGYTFGTLEEMMEKAGAGTSASEAAGENTNKGVSSGSGTGTKGGNGSATGENGTKQQDTDGEKNGAGKILQDEGNLNRA